MSRMAKVYAALDAVPELKGKVFPVVLPDSHRLWPAAVYARSGGGQVSTNRGEATLPLVRIDYMSPDYDDLEPLHDKVVASLRRADLLYLDPDQAVDLWDEDLEVYRQQVNVVVSQQ